MSGLRVLELGGLGPGPFAVMMLAEMGAEAVRVDRPGGNAVFADADPRLDLLNRGRRSIALDLKQPRAVEVVLSMAARADVLVEGYRPGVAERLGVGPEACWERNPRLVYGRATGWGQTGPLASTAGHDINYISVTGALHGIGEQHRPPQPPLNILGDFGGGGTYLVVGVLAALHEARLSGHGQVVDAAIVDGVAHLLTDTHGMLAAGLWNDERGTNLLDGGAPFYTVYDTSDGRHMAVGPLEQRFYELMLDTLGIDDLDPERQYDRDTWPATRARIDAAFRGRTQAEWAAAFEGTDACVTPVVSLREAAEHPQLHARGTLVERDGVLEPAPAPRFSRTPSAAGHRAPAPGEHTRAALADWGVDDVEALLADGVAVQA